MSSATIAASSTTDIGASDAEYVIVTGSATITSLGTTAAGIKREVVFASAGSVLTNSAAIVLPAGSNITVGAGDVFIFRSLGSGNWRLVADEMSSIITPDIAQSLIVRQGASGQIANATGSLSGLVVRGVGTGNAAFLEFLRDPFGAYMGIDTDNQFKVGGHSMGANAYRIVHEGLAAVSMPGSVTAAGTIAAPTITSTTSGVLSAGAGAGYSFNDRSSGAAYAWYGAANQIILYSNFASPNALITVSSTTGNTTVQGTWTGPNFISTSDRTKKKNIKKRKAREDLADRLDLVSFNWKRDNQPALGVIAQ